MSIFKRQTLEDYEYYFNLWTRTPIFLILLSFQKKKKISDALSIFTEAFLLHSSLVDQLADLIGAVRADKMRRKTEL